MSRGMPCFQRPVIPNIREMITVAHSVGRRGSMAKNGNGRGGTTRFPKASTGIQGLDEITGGGIPRGRPSLVCGGPGCGKTLLAMEFLVRGAVDQGEPGVFIAFEETAEELTANVRSLGFDLEKLVNQKKLLIEHVAIEASEIMENG